MKKIVSLLLAFVFAFGCAACILNGNSVTMADDEITLSVGSSKTIKVVTVPSDSAEKLVWSCSDEKVASVYDGKVTAKAVGMATVSAVMPTGEKAECKITVTKREGNEVSAADDTTAAAQTKEESSAASAGSSEVSSKTSSKAESDISSKTEISQAADYDVNAEVKQIRAWYYATQEDPGTHTENSEVLRYTKDGATTKFSVPVSYNNWMYERWYFYNNDKLYFAFVYKGSEEYRLYFKDDVLIRYIDNNGITYDYGKISCPMEDKVRTEAYDLLKSDIS